MIIFGMRKSQIKSRPVYGHCAYCNEPKLSARFLQEYLHFFWIPIFPLAKKPLIACGQCHKIYEMNEIDKGTADSLMSELQKLKTPLYSYVGLLLIALFTSFLGYKSYTIYFNSGYDYVANPHVGDILILQKKEGQGFYYQVAKIAESGSNGIIEIAVNPNHFNDANAAVEAIKYHQAVFSPNRSSENLSLMKSDLPSLSIYRMYRN